MPNVLRHLKILEVSSVDKGAGEGVRIVLMKRADVSKAWHIEHINDLAMFKSDPDLLAYCKREFSDEQRQEAEDKGQAMPGGGFPIKNTSDLRNAIQAIGRAKNPAAAKAHIKRRAEALGHSDMIPDTWKRDNGGSGEHIDLDAIEATVGKQEIEAMTLEELKKLIDEQVTATVAKAIGETIPEAVTKAVTEALDKGKKVKKAKPGSKGRFDSNPDEEHDGGDQERADAEESCDAETKKALEIAKLSPEVRKIIDEADQNAKLVKQFVQKQELEEFGKRAVGMGLKKEDGVLLQKAYTGDVASQKVLEERMATVAKARKAQEDTSVIFKEFGTNNGESSESGGTAIDQLNALAADLRKKDPTLTPAQAFTKVMTDPANVEVATRERQERMAKIHHLPAA